MILPILIGYLCLEVLFLYDQHERGKGIKYPDQVLENYLSVKKIRAPGILFTAQLRSSEQYPEKDVLQPGRATRPFECFSSCGD